MDRVGRWQARHVPELDPDWLPADSVSRLFVDLAEDGLGLPVEVPVLVAKGRRGGPVFGITAAIHGNELNGVRVLHELFARIATDQLKGTVVGVVAVNVPGLLARRRTFPDGIDPNHIMPGRHDGNSAQVYAWRLMQRVIRHMDFLVDLHTASFGRENTLYVRADMTNPATARMAYLQRPRIILHHPPADGTLRGAAAEHGIPAITVEIGDPHRFQPAYVRRSLAGLRAVMADLGMLPRRTVELGPEPVLCSGSRWLYTDRGGLLQVLPELAEHVEADQPIANLHSVFGDLEAVYRTPEAGVVIGKAVDPIAETGARLLHLGRIARPDDPLFPRGILETGPEESV